MRFFFSHSKTLFGYTPWGAFWYVMIFFSFQKKKNKLKFVLITGLISWVDGHTPIFALYKKWQQRQATSPKKEKNTVNTPNNASTAKNTPPPIIPRPSELYFQKLTPLLSKHNIKATQSSRKEWPLDVLKQVLSELTGKCSLFVLFHNKFNINISSLFCFYSISIHVRS